MLRSFNCLESGFKDSGAGAGRRSGFTLAEISIVMIIIGLLISGVLISRDMIQTAELRTIISERSSFIGAYKEFVDKYQAIPGDMNNATSIWSGVSNGGGNGMIGSWTNAAVGSQSEWFGAWQHLANAGLIDGQYSGTAGGGGASDAVIGTNVPASKSGKGGWTLLWMVSNTDNNFSYATSPISSHVLVYGAATASYFTDTAIISPISAKDIDIKTDDGMPFRGSTRVKRNTATTCAVSNAVTSDYLLTSETQACQLMFLMGM